MARAELAAQKRRDEVAFPVRVKIAVDGGLDMHTMVLWLQKEFPSLAYTVISTHNRTGIEWTNNFYVVCAPPASPVCDVEAAAQLLNGPNIWT